MMNPDPPADRVERIFSEALAISDDREREEHLQQACAGDAALLARVQALLQSAKENETFFQNADPDDEDSAAIGEREGDVIGHYKLLELIGEGGFGSVYMAEQIEPVNRRVALKIVKPGMDTRQVIGRFEIERQALAMMDHPSIARVFDAGATEGGRPYFVMELVRGIPITKFCDENCLTTEERLRLFAEVCDAVQHAHQKGIIHRDLKPSNILVTKHGSRAVPKIIDFGIAKATQQRLTDKTVFTRFHQFIGTPQYMSPEQADLSGLDIDTRSDIYSLGVLLYELLTGQTPFSAEELKKAGYNEICRVIREKDPVRPSTKVRGYGAEEMTTAAQCRRCEPDQFASAISNELDWIVMKAIEKDREHRYGNAEMLADDLQRFLANEPVSAAAPSRIYTLKKFIRRNRTSVVFGTVLSAAILSGLVLSMIGFVKASRANQTARAEAANAKTQAETVQAVLDFLNDDLFALASPWRSGPEQSSRHDIRLVEEIQIAARQMGERFLDRPLAEAAILHTIGSTLEQANEPDAGEPLLSRAVVIRERELGPEALDTLRSRESLALAWRQQERHEEFLRQVQSVYETRLRTLGELHEDTLRSLVSLGDIELRSSHITNAIRYYETILQKAPLIPELDPRIEVSALDGLVAAHYQQGNVDQRIELNRRIFETAKSRLGRDHILALQAGVAVVNNLHADLQKFPEAMELANQLVQRCDAVLGRQHPTSIYLKSEGAGLLAARGFFSLNRERALVELSGTSLDRNSWTAFFMRMRLGLTLVTHGALSEGIEVLEKSLADQIQADGPDNFQTCRTMRWLAGGYIAAGRFEEAERLRLRVLDASRRLVGSQTTWTIWMIANAGSLYARQGKWESAADAFRQYLEAPPIGGDDNPGGLNACAIVVTRLAGDPDGAKRAIRMSLERLANLDSAEERLDVVLGMLLVPESGELLQDILRFGGSGLSGESRSANAKIARALATYRGWMLKPVVETEDSERTARLRQASLDMMELTGSNEPTTAALAGFVRALTEHAQGNGAAARAALKQANETVEIIVRPGDLGTSLRPIREEWLPFAEAILARNEAEQTILGTIESPAINAAYLAKARERWQPVLEQIRAFNQLGRRGDWAGVDHLLVELEKEPLFDRAAVHRRYDGFHAKAALITALHRPEAAMGSGECLWSGTAASKLSPEDLNRLRLDIERQSKAYADGAIPFWLRCHGGLERLRSGAFREAIERMKPALEAYNLRDRGAAQTIVALAQWHLGLHRDARNLLKTAEQAHAELIEGNAGDFGIWWESMLRLEMILNEARSVMMANEKLDADA